MKSYGGAEVQTHLFVTSTLETGEWLTSPFGCFISAKKQLIHLIQEAGWAAIDIIVYTVAFRGRAVA
jgi:hypothetical protein